MTVQPGPLIIALRGRNATTGNDYYHLLSLGSPSPEIWSRMYLALYAMQGKTFYLSETLWPKKSGNILTIPFSGPN